MVAAAIGAMIVIGCPSGFSNIARGAGVPGFDAGNPAASGFKLTFDEEFNANDISFDARGPGPWWDGAMGYLGAANISVSNGVATLHYVRGTKGGGISTTPQTFNKGDPSPFLAPFFVEARVLMATSPSGVDWDSFWMFSRAHESRGTKHWCEFDIQENWEDGKGTDKLVGTLIDWLNDRPTRYEHYPAGIGALKTHEWHNVAGSIMRDPSGNWRATWYVDGRPVYSVPAPPICTTDPMDIILSANTHGGSPDHDMKIDWVHVWQKDGTAVQPESNFTGANGSADAKNGSTISSTGGQSR